VDKTFKNPLFIAYLALFLAATGGGAAYAAATIGSADIIDSSVASVDIHNKGVRQVDLQPAEAWHEVGAYGQAEPAFDGDSLGCCATAIWQNQTFGGVHETAAFYRDPYGAVHLKGTVCGLTITGCNDVNGLPQADVPIFTLPAGYRPQAKIVFSVMSSKGAIRVDVQPGGDVVTDQNIAAWTALDAISFRCAPSGVGGCP